MNIAILKTGLFPDADGVEEAISHFETLYAVYTYDATRDGLDDTDWDQAVDELLSADRIIVV